MYNYNNRNTKKFLICFCLSILVMGTFSFATINKLSIFSKNKSQEASIFTPKKEDANKASLLAVGDTMVYNAQLTAQYDVSSAKYNFNNNFEYVKKYVEEADYSMVNLETTLTGNKVYRYSSSPKFNSPDELADGLKYAGFDLISTANNHAYDKGYLSIKNTLATLKDNNFDVVGTRENSDERFIVKEINGVNVGVTSYSYGRIIGDNKYLNDVKVSDEYKNSINIFDSTSVDKAFKNINYTLKNMKDTDLQVVYLHWGDKYSLKENTFQKKLAQKLCDAGVDVIIGSHPHVVQPVTTIKSSDNKHETVVAYSLGNFLSNQSRDQFSQYTEDGLMLNIDISKSNGGDAKVDKVTCIPTWLNKYYNSKTAKYVYEIIPIANKSELDKIDNLSESKLKKSYKNTASKVDSSDLINIVENPFN
ncbi:CapA family protein [Terrisporobacter petrolearius]|uniref:CapA family protein n=1 Tax=Terrisporobacter petrolearius TaxID=1460447 RepID=UPI0031CC5A77